ncbi:spermidine/putrescine ABC transporter substrate-binding protein [Asticcacaulis sp. BYS171W]|uniref:Putrescine-binding periplasmic protein n=1 Tax=Asticcacaulis aquaticus TaxID=2984212 RepID=A0ABT5HS37_9CAUL|nr:spermidine/putrescine ABC transporter substrate-binding protein [Asticcacaulis aquaticus]MDC7682281.1 spermidine/putrescine ABC transporter substrate-binding protein [Asticcacaulis aquaticus]
MTFPKIPASRRSILQGLGAAAMGISFGGLAGCEPAKKKLNFYNWDTYIGPTTLGDFEKATGTPVNMSLFASNDELFAKLKAGNSGFDVIVPSNDFVERMSQANLLMPLDHAKIPNLKNVDPAFLNPPYDPGRKFSMPYTWLVLGIGYNTKTMKDGKIPDSWKYVFDSDTYAKKIAWLSEAGDLVRLAAKYLGHSVNALDDKVLADVEALLTKQVKAGNILRFHSDDGQDLLAGGDVDVVIEYNGDIAQKKAEMPELDFVVPVEGSQFNADTLAIPVGAPMPDEAHAFINYLLDAKAGAAISTEIKYPTPNLAAKALMPDSYKNNPIIFPPAEALAKCEYAAFAGAEMAQKMEELITRVRAAAGMPAEEEA